VDAEAYALGMVYRTFIEVAAALAPRSQQNVIGSSELGHLCDRRMVYKLRATPVTNRKDPLVSLIGTGFHAVMADGFAQINAVVGQRFLIETKVTYRGVPGTCDLYDRETRTVVDWKTSTVDKIGHMRAQGPASNYIVQVQCYAAGLAARGEDVAQVALVFVPRDGKSLDQIWVWRAKFDSSIADAAIDRMEALRGKAAASVPASPDRLCGWCSHYLPGSTDLSIGCPGEAS
jgi:hypothetical protein